MQNTNSHQTKILADMAFFLHDIRYIILFYVFGDFLTTRHALAYGFEENIFLRAVMTEYGVWSFLILKLVFLIIVYYNYKLLRQESAGWRRLWEISKKFIISVGIFLVFNNLMVIFLECSFLEIIKSIPL